MFIGSNFCLFSDTRCLFSDTRCLFTRCLFVYFQTHVVYLFIFRLTLFIFRYTLFVYFQTHVVYFQIHIVYLFIFRYTLLKLVQKFGELEKFDFLYHKFGPDKGKPRGYCFVNFKNKQVNICPNYTGCRLPRDRLIATPVCNEQYFLSAEKEHFTSDWHGCY